MPLTDAKLRSLLNKKNDSVKTVADRDGMSARVSKQGTIAFQYRYRINGKPVCYTIGRYPELTLAEARERLLPLRKLVMDGVDPRYASETKPKNNIDDCFKAWFSIHVNANLRKSTVGVYKQIYNKYVVGLFPTRSPCKVRTDEWLQFFDRISIQENKPVVSYNVLRVMKNCLSWCYRRSMIQRPALLDIQPRDVGQTPKQGDRVLTLHELYKIWVALEQTKCGLNTKSIVQLTMLFGSRVSEIRSALKSDFDLNARTWTVPAERSKINKPIRRPIPERCLRIIETLITAYPDTEYLCPGQSYTKPLDVHSVHKMVARLRVKLDIQHWRIHDFRRTLSTRLSEQGVEPHVTEKMLGHVLGGVMAVYNKHDWIDEQLDAYERYHELIFAKSGG
ncbi:tyrosine-type recombinase/integrase [Catenovulum sediminis]|uniref:Tyrosine-type recombinase/integrase n=1 Tax=Catenovulum sediminis TaxID=1740262 RepID=A0ABV1RKF9_9ALTE